MTSAMKAKKQPSASSQPSAGDDGFRARQEREVTANYEAFRAGFDELHREHAGQYALMRGGKVVECFSKMGDAFRAGKLLYKGDVFSVQRIRLRPVDLGLRRPPVLRAPSPRFSGAAPMTAAGAGGK